VKLLFFILGFISIGLGLFGIFLPILPTTPFAILAAFFFSKSSPRFQQKIYDLPKLGPVVQEWEKHGIISRKAKIMSLLTLWPVTLFGISRIQGSLIFKFSPIFIAIGVSWFILSRPSTIKQL